MLQSVVLLFCRKKKGGGIVTERQERFCIEFVRCGNATEAYKAAGYDTKSDNAAAAAGARMLRNVKVQEKIDELMRKANEGKIMDAAERRIRLSEIAAESKPIVAIKAIDVLNKMDGVYINKTQLAGADGGPLVFAWEGGGDGK